jgi:transcriptional regulator with GAF, ATPase, and Fis domain
MKSNMARVNLKRLVNRKGDPVSNILKLMQVLDSSICIVDADGALLIGTTIAGEKHPIELDEQVIGWVTGGTQAGMFASLLAQLAAREVEKKSLADEVLGLYREINLLYNLSERLAASLELEPVAQLALSQARTLIQMTDGLVMLVDEASRTLWSVATLGSDQQIASYLACVDLIIDVVAETGKAEIVNEVKTDPRYADCEGTLESMICAPLKVNQQVIGVIVLFNSSPLLYRAADLKLLNTLASQAGPAIQSAILYERTLREAKEREERLQQQIEHLKIELDEAKMQKQVAEITESDYFQRLREQAEGLRKSFGGAEP